MRTGLFGQCREVGRGDACAHQNLDAPGGAVHKLPEQGCPGGGAGGLAAGQNGGKPQSAGRVQCREGVAADVKGAVEGECNGAARFGGGFTGGLVDGAQGLCIQRTVRGQHTGDDAVCPGGDERGGRLFHLRQLPAVVAEITEAGAEQGADGQAGGLLDLPHQRKAGGGAAHDEVGAELQPVGPAALGRKGTGGAVNTNF